jgi:hypothetical protein
MYKVSANSKKMTTLTKLTTQLTSPLAHMFSDLFTDHMPGLVRDTQLVLCRCYGVAMALLCLFLRTGGKG